MICYSIKSHVGYYVCQHHYIWLGSHFCGNLLVYFFHLDLYLFLYDVKNNQKVKTLKKLTH